MNNTTQLSYNKDIDSFFCQETHGLGLTIAGLLFMIFVVVSCLFGNTLVCVASVKFSNLFSCSEMFILSLALSDIMVAVMVLPFDILYWITFPRWTLGGVLCNLWNSFFFLSLTASVLNLTAISIDRFLAVVYPLRYQALMTPKLNKFMIACVWIYSVGTGILIFCLLKPPKNERYSFDLNPYFYGFILSGNVIVPFFIMIVLYSKIYVIAKQHARRLGVASSSIPNTETSATSYRKKLARELKIAKTLGIVVLCFVICWLPFEIINVIAMVNGAVTCVVEIADTMACWLAYLHSSLNPLLYAFASCEFRRAFKRLLCIKREEVTG
ncbi:alpha-1A adrenergic receptor-like [Acropora millepora]|uniref:alpha-1A adrenergic receptor-like n=1 Tax=Acropora millepora TaxID=45264 RepID=UPI001CF26C20|nr:alpha-1A adrenergic receptor-like [Acropora millepora]